MPKTDLVCCLLRKHNSRLSRIQRILLEIKLFIHICQELTKIFKSRYKEYQRLVKTDYKQEENVFDVKLMQEMIKDILSTNEYSLAGMATYTRIPEEVLFDVVSGMNTDLTFETSKKIFELHILVRPHLYDEIMRKIVSEYASPIQ
ncbi:MAG: hypothetical protein ACD_60C00132G0013 [uncultured bacterium]|nr:MAG: hypothetical protein ACD_60C00132G0013 [uncultured bacterium]